MHRCADEEVTGGRLACGRRWRSRLLSAWLLSGTVLLAASWLALTAAWSNPAPAGLAASIRPGVPGDGSSAAAPRVGSAAADVALDPAALAATHGIDPASAFTVDWHGHLVVRDPGTHHLRLRADDGVVLRVDDVVVHDRLEHVGEQQASVPLALARGLVPISVRYVQRGGDAVFRLSWATPLAREAFGPVLTLGPDARADTFDRVERSVRWPRMVASAWSVWLLLGLLLALLHVTTGVAGLAIVPTLGAGNVIALALVAAPLFLINLDVGAQPWRSWLADEVQPKHVMDAWAGRFAGGWHYLYPPLHFYLLTIVNAPFIVMSGAGWLSFDDPAVHTAVHVLDRAVSGGLAWLTLVAAGLLGALTIDRSAARAVPWIVLGVPVFVFYARTTNVDMSYTFWSVVGGLAFVRAVTRREVRDHVWLGICAAAALATKDQAYGLFTVPALVLLSLAWRDARRASTVVARIVATVFDRRLWAGLLSFAAVYAVLLGVAWNLPGVRAHFALITGEGSAPFRMFPMSARGLEGLAATTIAVTAQTLGPVLVIALLAGVVRLLAVRQQPLLTLVLLLPVGYAFTFIGVVGYVYDRFLLGPIVFLAPLAAFGVEPLLAAVRRPVARFAVAATGIAVLLAPSIALHARIANDSRSVAEDWMATSLDDDPLVVGAGSELYLPNLAPYQNRIERRTSVANLLAWDADVIVLYDDWFGRPGEPSRDSVRHTLESAGYREQFAAGPPAPRGGWAPDFFSGLHIDSAFSNVGKVGPPLSIWRRDRSAASPATKGS